MKPRIRVSTGHLMDKHLEWRWRCESFTPEGFLHLAFGPTIEEAYAKWLTNVPYKPEPMRRSRHG